MGKYHNNKQSSITQSDSSFLVLNISYVHCVKSVRIRSYSGPYFTAFGLNTERYGVSLRIQSNCGKIRTRINPNTDTFYAVVMAMLKFKRIHQTTETPISSCLHRLV